MELEVLDLDEPLGFQGALEDVTCVVRAQHVDRLLNAHDLLGAEALALRPLVRLGGAGSLRVRDVGLVAGVLVLEVLLLLGALGLGLAAGAVLASLRAQRRLGGAKRFLLRLEELLRVIRGLRLGVDGLLLVVLEGLEHLREDVLDLPAPRRVFHLEGGILVELLPIRIRNVRLECPQERFHVALREEPLAEIHRLRQRRLHRDERTLNRRSGRHHVNGFLKSRDGLRHLVHGSNVVRVLLVRIAVSSEMDAFNCLISSSRSVRSDVNSMRPESRSAMYWPSSAILAVFLSMDANLL